MKVVLEKLLRHPDPAVRFLTLTDVLGKDLDDPVVLSTQASMAGSPSVGAILSAQYPAGYWMHPGLGISPRYRATAWQVLFLAQLGARSLPQLKKAARFLAAHNIDDAGAFCIRRGPDGRSPALTAALLWALGRAGFIEEPRLSQSWAWFVETFAEATVDLSSDPGTLIWGLRAAALWGHGDLLADLWGSTSGADAAMALPTALTFPLTHQPDRLAYLEMVVEIGQQAEITASLLDWLAAQQNDDGFWPLEHVPGHLWWNPGPLGCGNPWITIRALKVLMRCGYLP